MLLRELYLMGRDMIMRSGLKNPGLEASVLLSGTIDSKIPDLYTRPEAEVSSQSADEFKHFIERRIKGEPAAYILGEKEFYSRTFFVTPDVLIPRPETETLVDETLRIAGDLESSVILDVGIGSGCIGVTVACELENVNVVASDISPKAISVAGENAKSHGVAGKMSFVCGDCLSCFADDSFDIVVSNPPYVARSDFSLLDPCVRKFEPEVALVADEDGLHIIRRIAFESGRVLRDGGWCLVEIGEGQYERAYEIFENAGFVEISFREDLAGIKRMVKGKWRR